MGLRHRRSSKAQRLSTGSRQHSTVWGNLLDLEDCGLLVWAASELDFCPLTCGYIQYGCLPQSSQMSQPQVWMIS